jgi:hypothetical protein
MVSTITLLPRTHGFTSRKLPFSIGGTGEAIEFELRFLVLGSSVAARARTTHFLCPAPYWQRCEVCLSEYPVTLCPPFRPFLNESPFEPVARAHRLGLLRPIRA